MRPREGLLFANESVQTRIAEVGHRMRLGNSPTSLRHRRKDTRARGPVYGEQVQPPVKPYSPL
eukprot:scaffold25443_cov75-Phaeocystis_antarctica.AAC.3